MRKCFELTGRLTDAGAEVPGWRKIKYLKSELKSQFRQTSHQVFRGRNEQQKKQSVRQYLDQANTLCGRFGKIKDTCRPGMAGIITVSSLLSALDRYLEFAAKFSNQIERRLLKGEVIASSEKIYSIFEEHTEWISKGKLGRKVELGHLLLITTDQFHFIVDYKIMLKQKDANQVKNLSRRLNEKFKNRIESLSFDKGFWSKSNYDILSGTNIKTIVLPKRGKRNKGETRRETTKEFRSLRHKHSAVESNINMLEHHGLNRCMDKGLNGFKRCVGLSVLSYNLHILGNALLEKERKQQSKKLKLLKKAA